MKTKLWPRIIIIKKKRYVLALDLFSHRILPILWQSLLYLSKPMSLILKDNLTPVYLAALSTHIRSVLRHSMGREWNCDPKNNPSDLLVSGLPFCWAQSVRDHIHHFCFMEDANQLCWCQDALALKQTFWLYDVKYNNVNLWTIWLLSHDQLWQCSLKEVFLKQY